jgi:hypothetical protein
VGQAGVRGGADCAASGARCGAAGVAGRRSAARSTPLDGTTGPDTVGSSVSRLDRRVRNGTAGPDAVGAGVAQAGVPAAGVAGRLGAGVVGRSGTASGRGSGRGWERGCGRISERCSDA